MGSPFSPSREVACGLAGASIVGTEEEISSWFRLNIRSIAAGRVSIESHGVFVGRGHTYLAIPQCLRTSSHCWSLLSLKGQKDKKLVGRVDFWAFIF
jgi:hypothetical protein